jgi:electron transfer flavoprotein beta subunit
MNAAADTDDRPLLVVCLRITDLRPEVDPLSGSVRRDAWGIGLSSADGAALELALRIAGTWSARVLAVAVGPPAIEPVLREVAALGVAVVRVPVTEPGAVSGYAHELGGDEHALARSIVATVAPWGTPLVVLCGDRSDDRGTGALPAFLAHELGAAQALGLVALDVEMSGATRALTALRRLDGGWRERLSVPLPAVCSVEGAGVRLRRSSLAGALAAGATAVPVDTSATWSPEGTEGGPGVTRVGPGRPFEPRTRVLPAPDSEDPRLRLLALTGALVAHEPPIVVGPVDAGEAADELLGFLVRHGYLAQLPGTEGSNGTVAETVER